MEDLNKGEEFGRCIRFQTAALLFTYVETLCDSSSGRSSLWFDTSRSPFANFPTPTPEDLDNLRCHRYGYRNANKDEAFVNGVCKR